MNGWLGGGVKQAQEFFIYCLLPFLLYAGLVNTPKKQYWIFIVFAVACAVMIHHGISQKLSPDSIGWSGVRLFGREGEFGRIRFLGIFNDPNDLGMFFAMNIPIMFYMKSVSKNILLKITFTLMIAALLFGIYLTNSRGTLVGVLGLLFTYFYFKFGKTKTIVLGAFSIPILLLVISLFRTIDTNEASAYGRVEAWYAGVQMIKSNPLLGTGKGSFRDHHVLTAHNSYVLIMAELGVIGYVLWLTTILLTAFMLMRILSLNKEDYPDSPELHSDIFLAKCLFFSLVAFICTGFFLSRSYEVLLYVFIGLSCALFSRVLKEVPEIIDVISKKNIGILCSLSLASLIALYIIISILL